MIFDWVKPACIMLVAIFVGVSLKPVLVFVGFLSIEDIVNPYLAPVQ